MTGRNAAGATAGLTYLAYTGCLVAVVVILTLLQREALGERGWMFTRQLLAVAAVTAAYAVGTLAWTVRQRIAGALVARAPWLAVAGRLHISVAVEDGDAARPWLRFRSRAARWYVAATPRMFAALCIATYGLAAAALLALDHRRWLLAVAAAQAFAVGALRPARERPEVMSFAAVLALAWALVSGLTYTRLGDWIAALGPTEGLAPFAFVAAFGIATWDLVRDPARDNASVSRWNRRAIAAFAVAVFAAYALRTDHQWIDWVPIHRSFFADTAQFVRDGHLLLWDVPSLYGLLSMAALAVVPARDAWQALYILTAAFMLVQSSVTFAILRYRRSGWANAAFAILLPLGAFGESIFRYAWSGRLYPQGGMRFVWVVTLLGIAFASYARRDDARSRALLRAAGWTVWLVAVFWSVENAVWATSVWFVFVSLDALAHRPRGRAGWIRRFIPFIVLPALAVGATEAAFRMLLHHAPDWRCYVEFLGLFASGSVRQIFHVQDFGAAWTLLLVLGAVGATGMAALRLHRWSALPPLGAAWTAVWATSSYYALEPLDGYVALLLAVLVPAAAIAVAVGRDLLAEDRTAFLARIAVAPLATVLIALTLGEPARMAGAALPLTAAWAPDPAAAAPAVPAELAALFARAGVEPGAAVNIANGPLWTELRQGLILPYAHTAAGPSVRYRAWLPSAPVGPQQLWEALPPARRALYARRFLERSRSGGWYVTYRSSPGCASLDPSLRDGPTFRSTNFTAVRCAYRAPAPAKGSRRAPVQPLRP